jgi:hypothetical protein
VTYLESSATTLATGVARHLDAGFLSFAPGAALCIEEGAHLFIPEGATLKMNVAPVHVYGRLTMCSVDPRNKAMLEFISLVEPVAADSSKPSTYPGLRVLVSCIFRVGPSPPRQTLWVLRVMRR